MISVIILALIIIFNNYGSINNNIFIENPKKNFFEENQRSSTKAPLTEDKPKEKEKAKEKIIRNFNFLKDNTIKLSKIKTQ